MFLIEKAIDSLKHPGIDSNLLQLAKNALPYFINSKLSVPDPITIYWSINSICNLRCKMCDVGTFNEEGTFYKNLRIDKKLHEIDINIFKKTVKEFSRSKPYMSINSTEPLMYKDIVSAIDYCTSLGINSSITTGAYFLPKYAKDLANSKLHRLNVSLDGPKDIHNEIRGRSDVYERAIEGIKIFNEESIKKGYKPEINLCYTITNLNYNCIDRFYNEVKNIPHNKILFAYMWFLSNSIVSEHNSRFNEVYPISPSCYDDYVNPEFVDTKELHSQLLKVKNYKNVHILGNFNKSYLDKFFHKSYMSMNNNSKCMASWFFVQILADGNVIVYSRCHNESLGNINQNTLKEIWNGEKIKKWRHFIKNSKTMPMCKRCDLAY